MKIKNHIEDIHERYNGQDRPVYLLLDVEEQALYVDYDAEIGGGTPESQYHRRVLAWKIPVPGLTADGADALCEHVREDAEALLEEVEIERDGQGNLVGRMTEHGYEIEERIYDAVQDWAIDHEDYHIQVWDAASYYEAVHHELVQRLVDGETIDSLRDEMEDEDTDGAGRTLVLRDVEDYLEALDEAADKQIREETDPTDVARELLEQVRSHGGEIKAGEEAIAGWMEEASASGDLALSRTIRVLGEDVLAREWDSLVEEILEVRVYDDTYCVEDTSGQVWWPDEATAAEIAASDDPKAAALRICEDQPMRGEWKS